jgi:hypothetical protein
VRETLGDAGVEPGEIGAHRVRLEGDRQRAPVQAVLVEIEQHQSAWKKLVEHDAPSERGREHLLRIEEHQFVGLRTKHGHVGMAEGPGAVDHAEALHAPLYEPPVVGDNRERMADERPTVIAGNLRKRCTGRARRAIGRGASGIEGLNRHGRSSVTQHFAARYHAPRQRRVSNLRVSHSCLPFCA